jgi:hypothetical protein
MIAGQQEDLVAVRRWQIVRRDHWPILTGSAYRIGDALLTGEHVRLLPFAVLSL